MKKEIMKEFTEEYYIDVIKNLIKINNGYVTSKLITELGIHRMYLSIMIKKNIIERVNKGVYMDKSLLEDVYYVFQLRYPKVIFSGFTALYFHELTDKFCYEFEVTVSNNYHSNKIKEKHYITRCKDEIYNLGIVEVVTSHGNKVSVYDKERCICDLVKYKDKYDYEDIKKIIKLYKKDKNKNSKNLKIYAKKLNIYTELIELVGICYE